MQGQKCIFMNKSKLLNYMFYIWNALLIKLNGVIISSKLMQALKCISYQDKTQVTTWNANQLYGKYIFKEMQLFET